MFLSSFMSALHVNMLGLKKMDFFFFPRWCCVGRSRLPKREKSLRSHFSSVSLWPWRPGCLRPDIQKRSVFGVHASIPPIKRPAEAINSATGKAYQETWSKCLPLLLRGEFQLECKAFVVSGCKIRTHGISLHFKRCFIQLKRINNEIAQEHKL